MADIDVKANLDALLLLPDNMIQVMNGAFRAMANDVVKTAKENIGGRSGLNNRSGALRNSIRIKNYVQPAPNKIGTATIVAGNEKVPYSRIHEYGGIIRAKNKPYLVFKIGEQWVRKKEVKIPARPYLLPAAIERTNEFQKYVDDALQLIKGQVS